MSEICPCESHTLKWSPHTSSSSSSSSPLSAPRSFSQTQCEYPESIRFNLLICVISKESAQKPSLRGKPILGQMEKGRCPTRAEQEPDSTSLWFWFTICIGFTVKAVNHALYLQQLIDRVRDRGTTWRI